ncbi:MAG: peptidylprolyl isomerase [Deltaproteobacteria bacterium]|nr:peptidylprolyl isomerase [Deltaproteobacteria bacterium]
MFQVFLKSVLFLVCICLNNVIFAAYPEEKIKFVASKKDDKDKIVASVNNVPIYLSEFEKKYDYATRSQPFTKKISKKEFLDHLIKFELVVQKAFEEKIHQTEFAREAFRQTLNQLVYANELTPKLNKITTSSLGNSDLQRFFKKNGFVKLSQIVLRIPYEETEAKERGRSVAVVQNKAQNIYQEVLKNPNLFDDLAKRHSQAPEAPVGGDIGFKTKADLPPEISDLVFKMKKAGDVAPPLKTIIGYHILKLTQKPASLSALSEEDLKLFKEKAVAFKQMEVAEEFYKSLEKKASIKVYSSVVQ